jgi:hypothetical protein
MLPRHWITACALGVGAAADEDSEGRTDGDQGEVLGRQGQPGRADEHRHRREHVFAAARTVRPRRYSLVVLTQLRTSISRAMSSR